VAGRYETSDVAPCLQPVNPLDVNERSDEQLDPHPASESPAAVIKRKTSDPDDLAPDHKRVCIESVLIDLDALSLVDESQEREPSTPKTADSEDRPSLTIQQPTSREFTALVLSTGSAKLQSTRSSNIGAPQSMSICGSSIGSLFGRTSIQIPELWMTWSSISPPTASLKSFHSIGMPAPMLGSVDEELSLSRTGNDLGEPRYWNDAAIEAFVTEYCIGMQTAKTSMYPEGARAYSTSSLFLKSSRISMSGPSTARNISMEKHYLGGFVARTSHVDGSL
jgi:hypothetical protein